MNFNYTAITFLVISLFAYTSCTSPVKQSRMEIIRLDQKFISRYESKGYDLKMPTIRPYINYDTVNECVLIKYLNTVDGYQNVHVLVVNVATGEVVKSHTAKLRITNKQFGSYVQ
jgi:hypothetical protein